MLKKELTIPGAIIKTRSILKNGVIGGKEGIIPHLNMTQDAGSVFDGICPVPPNTTLVVVHGPKKRQGINTVKVRFNEVEGHVYWCELRASCDHF